MSGPAIAQNSTPPPTTPTPAPSTPPSAPATHTTKALAQAKKDNRRIEIEPLRSERTTFYANPDGKTVRMELNTRPIRIKNADGKGFTPIDTTLVESDGAIRPKAVHGDLVLSDGKDRTLLQSRVADATAKISSPSALPEPRLKGNTATYPGVYGKGRDLVVSADPSGFRQQVTIAARPGGPVSFQVPVDLPAGLSFKTNATGQPAIVDKDGATLTEVRPTLLRDATAADTGAPLDAGKIGRAAVTLAEDNKTLVFTPDAAFLADPATTYPVTLTAAASDWWEGHSGQWWRDGGAMDTWINDYDYQDSWDTFTQTQIVVGKSYASSIAKRWRGYLKFPNIPAEFAGSTVDNADLHLWNYESNECGVSVGTGITARQITSSWDETTLTWNSQPSVTSTGADTEYGAYGENCTGSMAYPWNLTHTLNRIVKAWIDGAPNYGIQLTAGNESELRNWRRYTSEDAGGCMTEPLEDCKFEQHPPILTVDFEPPVPRRRETVVIATPELLGTFPEYEEAIERSTYTPDSFDEVASIGLSPEIAAKAETQRDGQPYFVGTDKLDLPEQPVDPDEPTDPDGEDTLQPRVVGHDPAADATAVPLDAKARVTFSEPVGGAVVSVKTAQGTAITGTTAYDGTEKILTFSPQDPLKPGSTYTVEVSEAIDSSENAMDPYTWSFTTLQHAAGQWKFDEGTGGTAVDSSGNDHDANLTGTAAWIAGKSGNAVSNAPAQARIAASRTAAQQGKAVEVTDETTATSITHAQPDGKTFKTEITAGPVRSRHGGGWTPIDTTLAEQSGRLRAKALAEGAVVEISAGGTDPFVKMSAAGKSYALRWPTPLPKPTVTGSVATYADAAGVGADLVVTALPDGFRYEVVLRQRPSKPLELRIGVEDEGLTLSEGKDGRLLLKGEDKKLVAAAAPATVWDGAEGRPAQRGTAAGDLVTKDGRTELVVKPDQAFLTDPATTYPVSVAAAVTLPTLADAWISDYGVVGSSTYRNTTLWVGSYDDGDPAPLVERAYMKFDTATLSGTNVSAATLGVRTTEAYGCGDAQSGLKAQRITTAWTDTALTWDNKPDTTTAGEALATDRPTCAVPGTLSWNLAAMTQAWASGTANHGILLRGVDETFDGGRPPYNRAFESFNGTNKPTLNVTYTLGSTPTVSALQISPATNTGGTVTATSLTPQLAATVADTAGGNLTGQFEVEHDPAATGQGSGQIWAGVSPVVTGRGQAAVSVPAGRLADGWKIRWRARAVNASSTSAWSDWQTATVDVPNPTVSAFQVTPSQVVNGITVATSLTPALLTTVTDPAAQPVRAEYELEHDPAATGQGTGQIWTGAVDNVASGTQASATVPGGRLTDGWKVRWRVRAANTVSSPWSDWQNLTIDVPDAVSEPAVGALQVSPSEQVDGVTVTPTRTPALLAQVSDPAGKPLSAEAEIEHDPAAPSGQGSGQIWTGNADNVPAGTQASITVPADTLTDGWKVRWRARAVSATAASAWSDWQSFTVSLPKPTATGLAITPSKVVDGVTATTSLTPTLQATLAYLPGQTLRAEAEIEHDPAAPSGQGSGQIWAGAVDNVASGTQASVTVPGGKLTDGWKVRWRLRAVTSDVSSAWSGWRQVTVDVLQPGEEPLAQTAGPVIRTDQSFTVATWLRWSDKDGDYSVAEQRGTHQAPFRLGNTADHGLVFTLASADAADATAEGVLSDVEPPVDEWFHLAGVYDATAKTASLYLNGTLVKTSPVGFTTWNADTALTLGSRMRGDLDEAQVYQRSFDAAEIAALLSAPAARKESSAVPTSAAVFNYNFDYEHINAQNCKDTGGFDYKYFQARIQQKPYVSCWSAYLYVQDFEEDPISRTMKKSATKSNIYSYLTREFGSAIFEDDDQFRFRATWVMHSYLGDKTGNAIHPTPSGDLRPQDIKVFTRLDEIAVEDSTGRVKLSSSQLRGLDMGIGVEVEAEEPNTSCSVRSGTEQTKDVSAWHTDPDDEFIIRAAASNADLTPNCIIKPMAAIWDDPIEPSWFYLWSQYVKDEQGLERGVRRKGDTSNQDGEVYAPYFRCDFKTFKSKAGWRTGACINPTASRIFEMSLSKDKAFIEITQHIQDALYPATNKYSFPPMREEGHDWDEPSYPPTKIEIGTRIAKDIPGNWAVAGSDPLVRGGKDIDEVNRGEWSNRELFMDVGTDRYKHWINTRGTNYCKYYFSERYPAQVHPDYPAPAIWMNCDEYPLATTKQGAASAEGHYSLRAVSATQNRAHGDALGAFYSHYRVGSNNPFWVAVVD
ncbi:DNRLRE domain-containing protein [Nonomuraea sp. H19]|uniref:DNRLRE domain-containing protein n=1 Tax=Nonomuraea sp. H19 TaxID=3452206 RepID=UPI003F89D33F